MISQRLTTRAAICCIFIFGFGPRLISATLGDANWTSVGSGMDQQIRALAIFGSELYAGGAFGSAGGAAATRVAKWNGSTWSALGLGLDNTVEALAVWDGNICAGGYFTHTGSNSINHIGKWEGGNWSNLGLGVNSNVYALATSGSNLYAGGAFTAAGGSPANYIAKWDGTGWSALGSGVSGFVAASVNALAVSGNDLYIGGSFTNAGGIAANNIAKWNGSSWSALGSGTDFAVLALAVADTNLYAGGSFFNAGGSNVNFVAKWEGSTWKPLGRGLGGFGAPFPFVLSLAVVGTDLYAGGCFSSATNSSGQTVPANFIARWDGSNWSSLGSGVNSLAFALAPSGDDLYVGGGFNTAGQKTCLDIARAYLLTLPNIAMQRSASSEVIVSWPSSNSSGFFLEQCGAFSVPQNWLSNTFNPTNDGTYKSVILPATNNAQFFRLRRS